MFEVGARPGHPSLVDVVAYAGISFGIAVQAFAGHPTSTDVVARPAIYAQTAAAVAPPSGFPTQYEGLRYWDGAVAVDLCLVAAADYNLAMGAAPMIKGTAATYAVYLVETTDPNASPVRVQTSAGTKAIREKT